MINRFPSLLFVLLALPASAATLEQAQSLAGELAAQAAGARAVAQQPRQEPGGRVGAAVGLACKGKSGAVDFYFTGMIDAKTKAFDNTRSEGVSPLIDLARVPNPVDERCGTTLAPLAENLNYEVTPRHDWGQSILQLPKNSLSASASFTANLHVCHYDGDWSVSEDVALDCTLTSR